MFCFSLWFAHEDNGDWVILSPRCWSATERTGLLCLSSPHEASWPRISRKFAFWGYWRVADTSSYIEDRSLITLLSPILFRPSPVASPLSGSWNLSSIFFPACCWSWHNIHIPYKWHLSLVFIIPRFLHPFFLTRFFAKNNIFWLAVVK